jgi:hypothetical protein
MRIVPFEPAHLLLIEPGAIEVKALANADLGDLMSHHRDTDPAFSIVHGDRVLASSVVTLVAKGVASAWLLASDEMRRHPVFLHKHVRRGMELVERGLRLRRLQIVVRTDLEVARRWAERLGFRCEGEMAGYGPNGENYWLYARVKNGNTF